VKGLRRVRAQDLESANAYLEQVFIPLWNRRFTCEARMGGDAHRRLRRGTNLDSVLSIRESRRINADHTVRWEGSTYRIPREQIAGGMRGAGVQVERRLEGSRWMHWRNRIVPLERCATTPVTLAKRPAQSGPPQVRSAEEKARAKQRQMDGRQRWTENFKQLRSRPIWQALSDFPLGKPELR